MAQFTPPDIWKRHSVLLGIHAGGPNTKIFQCFGVSLRTVQMIRKEWNEYNGNYEGTVTRKPHSFCYENNFLA